MEKGRSGYRPEPGPGVSTRKMERLGKRVVFDGAKYHVVQLENETRVRRGPGRYSGDVLSLRPAQA